MADATYFLKLRLSLADGDELPAQMQAIVRAVAVKKFICNKKTVSMILTAFFYLVGWVADGVVRLFFSKLFTIF